MERDPSQVGVTTENPAKIHQELIPSSSFKRKDGQKRRKQNDYIPGINIYIYGIIPGIDDVFYMGKSLTNGGL